ncbi:MAG TPA: VWA domain-containing protein [Thermoanaerobaculia bacterium]|nr:VWA domain-containing protein [Thermoanaerobaculia bacterium]
MAPGEAPRTLRDLALDRDGRPLGEHSLTLTEHRDRFDVAIRMVEEDPASGVVDVEVTAAVPPGERLERLELYRNDERVAVSAEATLRHRLRRTGSAAGGYVRAVAVLAGGDTAEDARPLAGAGRGDHVRVNWVELTALATGRDGSPVRGLAREDFRVLLDGRELPLARLREANRVPLTLGLVVDSSTSMRPIMEETREAAHRFLRRVLAAGDRAFLVEVSTRPRLAHGLTGDAEALAAAFDGLEADGDTALYDSLALAAAELLPLPGRRAVVVLTDGADSASHLGLGRCQDLTRRAGVPVYVLSLGGLHPGTTRPDESLRLRAFAHGTGGRLFALTGVGELDRAYDRIEEELRSQYLLAVAAERSLTSEELARIEVRSERRGLRVRAAARAAER